MRFAELFEGDNGKLSMRSLATFMATFTMCCGIIMGLNKEEPSEGIVIGLAGILSGLVGGIVIGNKFVEGSVEKSKNQQPIVQADTINVDAKT